MMPNDFLYAADVMRSERELTRRRHGARSPLDV